MGEGAFQLRIDGKRETVLPLEKKEKRKMTLCICRFFGRKFRNLHLPFAFSLEWRQNHQERSQSWKFKFLEKVARATAQNKASWGEWRMSGSFAANMAPAYESLKQ